MPPRPQLFIRSFAYRGDACSWQPRLEATARRMPPPAFSLSYNTRRLGRMVSLAIEAALEAIPRSGLEPADLPALGVVALSHNGPCIYSEGFFQDVVAQADPQLVSPSQFAESVMNIAATHLSLALQTHQPAYTFNLDLDHAFDFFDTVFLLAETGQLTRGVFCVCEEFSELCARVFALCPEVPGETFLNGAMVGVFSSRPSDGPGLAALDRPGATRDLEVFLDAMRALALESPTRFVWSAYSSAPPPLGLTETLALEPSILDATAMTREQGFMLTRLAEVLSGVAPEGQGPDTVLVQGTKDGYRWLTVRQPRLA